MMLPPDLIGRLRPAAETSRVPALAGRVGEASPVAPVRAIEAEVEALLADGRYRVRAGERRFDVLLPAPARPGELVSIAAPAGDPGAHEDADDVAARLSATGRLVSRLAEGLGAGRTGSTTAATLPLLPDAPLDTALTAATLRELIALGGLFQESQPAIRHEAVPAPQQPLSTPEARVIAWSGQIWPGQPMHWELEPDGHRGRESGEPVEGGAWTTRVELALPRLGRVEARMALGAAGLAIRLAADSTATAALFEQRRGQLHAALVRAGLPPAVIAGASHARY